MQRAALVAAILLSVVAQAQNQGLPAGNDCSHIQAQSPQACSGVYLIQPPSAKTPFQVYCEMRSDGGWTVLQRRSGAAESFDRKWQDYEKGFGNLENDHWLGLDKLSSLTRDRTKNWTMRVDLWDHESGSAYAQYTDFRVGGAKDAYKLHVGNYSGDAGDAIRGAYKGIDQNGFGFSTVDRDNDGCRPCIFGDIVRRDCASIEGGGWWFSRCGSANLNGDWHPAGNHIGWASGVHWDTWKDLPYSMRQSRMMIRA